MTTTTDTRFENIINALRVMRADNHSHDDHELADYLHDVIIRCDAAGKVTRLDLHHVLNAYTEYSGDVFFAPASDAERFIVRLYDDVDAAAAFANDSTPLVFRKDARPDAWDYSVSECDTPDDLTMKAVRQAPSSRSMRDWVAR